MKKLIITSLIALMVVGTSFAAAPGIGDGIVDDAVLIGQHYNLNIIGVSNPKNANMDNAGGGVIFVDLYGKSKISLVESGTNDAPGTEPDEFKVLDKNGTGGSGAVLALPDPGLEPYVIGDEGDADTITNYSIFVRPLGKPDGWAKITTCADIVVSELMDFLDADDVDVLHDAADLGGVCSIESTGQLLREKGQSIFTNQTAALLTMVLEVKVDYEDDGVWDVILYVRVPIFDDILANEYWEYEDNGLKLLQVRIYRVGTDVTNADDPSWVTLPLP